MTETYISLRRLENEALATRLHNQMTFGSGDFTPIKVSIEQFYGIEINDFAVTVAKTALWIAESQMMKETENIVLMHLEFLPLKSYANIVEGNALRIDWESVVPKRQLNYIMGNPPFVAKTGRTSAKESHSKGIMSEEQKKDKELFFGKNAGLIDYVACWYMKAAQYTKGTNIVSAFVATSSICQGQQVYPIWTPLLDEGIVIEFGYKNFKWVTEAKSGAYVYVVIVGFSHRKNIKRRLYNDTTPKIVNNISPYLIDGENILIKERNKPICDVPEIGMGNQPIDNGNYLFKENEMVEFIKSEPLSKAYFHPWYGAEEFINRKPRYCLWLGECSPAELKKMHLCMERVKNVRDFRL